MRGKKEETSSAKQETFSASGVCVGAYVLEVGADCRSFSRFAPRPEKENARALADAFEESERDDLSAPVAALEELDERAADVTDKIEHAHALLKDVLSGRFDRAFVMREIDGLLGLSERLDRDGRYEEQVRLARALHGLLATMLRWLDLIRMLRRALRSAKASNDQAGQAWALHELGTLHLSAGDTETAERLLRDALRVERRLDAVGSCTTRHNLDFCTRGRFVRRAAAVKVVAALVVFTFVITAAGVLAGAALSGDEHAATPSLGPDASFGALLVGETSAPQTVSLEAGAAALRIGRITVDDPREFLVDSSCPTELEPGQPCPIEVRFRPTAPGERASELRVALEGVGLLRAKLTGVGMNVVAARLDPDSLDLGEADVGTRTAAKTAILHAGSKPLRVTSVTSGSRAFGVESECSGTLAAGESCKIEVTFAPAAPGADATTLTVTKGDGGALRTALQGTGVANQPETHDPPVLDDFLDLGEVGIGDSSSEQALTLTAGSRPLTVATTESNSPEFQVAATCLGTLDANESCEIEVVFGPTAEGRRRSRLEVTTGNGRVLTGELRGTGVRQSPDREPTLTRLRDVGEATVGTRLGGRPLVLTAGSEELSGVEVASDSPEFAVEAHCPTTLAAGASCPIQVVFAPAGTGLRTATVTVEADGREPLTTELEGYGVLIDPPKLGRFLELGDVDLGLQSPARTLTLIAGSEPLTIRGISTDSTEFRVKDHCRRTLGPRERCEIRVAFAPTTPDVRTATLTVTREGGRALRSVLRGTGVEPPKLDPSLELGEVDLGRSSEARTLTVAAGSKNVTITGVTSERPGEFRVTSRCPEEVAAGSSCQIEVVFAPAADGSRTASLEVAVAGRQQLRAQLTGTGVVPPTIRPAAVDFGRVAVDTREPATIRLTAGSKPSTVTAIRTDDTRQFIVSNACERRLDPAESCDITVLFRPLAAESHSARLTVAFSDRPGLEVRLTGAGIEGFISLDPGQLDFGSSTTTPEPVYVTLTNTGPAPLRITSITTDSVAFSVGSRCPAVLSPGRSCIFRVAFTPPDFGRYEAWIRIDADGGGQHTLFATGQSIQSPIR